MKKNPAMVSNAQDSNLSAWNIPLHMKDVANTELITHEEVIAHIAKPSRIKSRIDPALIEVLVGIKESQE